MIEEKILGYYELMERQILQMLWKNTGATNKDGTDFNLYCFILVTLMIYKLINKWKMQIS
jgi:hypothetical protein